jgi:hypothetical protein
LQPIEELPLRALAPIRSASINKLTRRAESHSPTLTVGSTKLAPLLCSHHGFRERLMRSGLRTAQTILTSSRRHHHVRIFFTVAFNWRSGGTDDARAKRSAPRRNIGRTYTRIRIWMPGPGGLQLIFYVGYPCKRNGKAGSVETGSFTPAPVTYINLVQL